MSDAQRRRDRTPLGRRLRWSPARLDTPDPVLDRAVMARAAVYLFATSSTLALVGFLIEPTRVEALAAIAGGYVAAATLLLAFDRLDVRAFQGTAAVATTLITVGIVLSGDPTSPAVMFYPWVALYAAYFFSRRAAAAHLALIGAAYAGSLVLTSAPAAAARWVVAAGSVVTIAVLFRLVRERVFHLLGELRSAVRSDPLTGALNRRGFDERLEIELERARRDGQPLSILAGDVDDFKLFNDTFGHVAGDRVLERIGSALSDSARAADVVARLGGDEFLVLLPGTDREEAERISRRLAGAVESALAREQAPPTMTFGVATTGGGPVDADGLLLAADDALYAGKRRPSALGRWHRE